MYIVSLTPGDAHVHYMQIASIKYYGMWIVILVEILVEFIFERKILKMDDYILPANETWQEDCKQNLNFDPSHLASGTQDAWKRNIAEKSGQQKISFNCLTVPTQMAFSKYFIK